MNAVKLTIMSDFNSNCKRLAYFTLPSQTHFVYLILITYIVSKIFCNFISLFPKFKFLWRRCMKHSRLCLITFPNTTTFVKNTPLCMIFSSLFLVFGKSDPTWPFMFNIILLQDFWPRFPCISLLWILTQKKSSSFNS